MLIDLGSIGNVVRVAYGEGFVREKPELYSCLPVPELMIRQTETGDTQNVRKMYGLNDGG